MKRASLLLALASSVTTLAHAQAPSSWSPEPFVPPANVRPLSVYETQSQIHVAIPQNRLRGDSDTETNFNTNTGANQPMVARWKSMKNQPIAVNPQTINQDVFEATPRRTSTSSPIKTATVQRFVSGHAETPQANFTVDESRADSAPHVERVNRNEIPQKVQQAGTWTNRQSRNSKHSSDVQIAAYQVDANTIEAPPLQEPGFNIPSLPEAVVPNELDDFPPFQSRETPSEAGSPNQLRELAPSTDTRSLIAPENSRVAPSPFLPPDAKAKSESPSDLDSPTDRSAAPPKKRPSQTPPKSKSDKKLAVDCDDVRSRAINHNIAAIQLDVAPQFGVGPKDKAFVEEKRSKFAGSAPTRQWYDYSGRPLADGRLVDLENDSIIIESESGERLALSIRELSDADTVYISESWGLPVTCSLGEQLLAHRAFEPTTMAWKASGLCHKPLYFEEIQLERSGHEHGPIIQPFLSTAHFLGNLAFLPYKVGINPSNECQYALGHYRPGNCAPWSIEPIPLSLRGLAAQGAVIGGAVMILP